ncbi:MAG: polysaccharide biosynthesis protein [Rhizobiaceae bacterium]|nr:polysaccharide biosynthesis protein [Rhizobiaceae bacterium]
MSFAQLREWVSDMPRRRKQFVLVAFDAAVLATVAWIAFSLRFNRLFEPNMAQAALILAAPLIAIPVFVRLGLYRAVIRYLPERALWTIIQAMTVATLIWVSLAFLTQMTGASGIPRSIPLVYWSLSIAIVAGSRFGAKWLLGRPLRNEPRTKVTLIHGTGEAALQLAKALGGSPDAQVAGFVSDDPNMHGMDILGIRVYPEAAIARLIPNLGITELIITSGPGGGPTRRDLLGRLSGLPVKVRILPAIADLAAGKYLVSHVRDIDIDDLLGRTPVPADASLLQRMGEARAILVTGAAGSIGSQLCRTIAALRPGVLVALDFNEYGLYRLERDLAAAFDTRVVPVLGSVTDAALLENIVRTHQIDTIFHCAAYKHVPLVEQNVLEGVRNNVFGAKTLAEVASAEGVANLILISSDKAVRPSSVMGATKRWAELIVRYYGVSGTQRNRPRNFASVRFGNVLGSSGSVVPLFKEQISSGGPVTLTDENMTRYFMSIREAAELIVQAGGLSESGDILMLDMGEPVRIKDLAEDMILLAGLSVKSPANPEGDIEIVTIGPREGEKLHEELFYDPQGVTATSHPKILRARRMNGKADAVPEALEQLAEALAARDEVLVRNALFDFVRA